MPAYRITTQDGHKTMAPILNEEEYRALRNSPRQLMLVKGARSGKNPKLKQQLLQICYSCIPGPNGLLKGCKTASDCVGMDIDFDPNDPDYAQKMQSVPQLVLSHSDELGLLMLERSVGKGYHLVFRRRYLDGLDEGRVLDNQVKNLRWAADMLGVMFDEGAKDITRVFFSTTAGDDDLLYLDPALFEGGAAAVTVRPADPVGLAGQVVPVGPPQHIAATEKAQRTVVPGVAAPTAPPTAPTAAPQAPPSSPPLTCPSDYQGVPYATIVEALASQLGGAPEHGSRNQFIFAMACHLRYVCNDDPQWIAQVLPDYGEDRERWMSTIRSACNRAQNKKMPALLTRALAMARMQCSTSDQEQPASYGNGATPPDMPKRLPALIKLLISRTPKIYQPAVAHAVFPALATHLWHTRFRYIDNVEHEATLMNVLMAGTGAGKNCIAAPIDCIMRDIRERDAVSLEKEHNWKEEMQTKGANKDKRKRPEGLVIQEVDADMTNAAFVLRLSEAEEHFLYVKMNEIDQFDALKTSSRSKSQFQIMCLAFDPGNSYGQTRVGTQSISARVCIRFNWNASTTILKGRQYFKTVLTDGPISRINFCTIPEQPIGADMPIYGTYDAAFHDELRPYIERLCAARGLIECPQASRLAKKLKEENADFARLSQSRTYENLSFRANVIAFLKAMVLYVAQGEQWDRTIEDFVRWSEQYDLWCKMHFFGAGIDEANGIEQKPTRPGPRNLLNELPDRFTTQEAVAVRRRYDMSADGTGHMLSSWKSRGYIDEDIEQAGTWVKTRKYLEGGF